MIPIAYGFLACIGVVGARAFRDAERWLDAYAARSTTRPNSGLAASFVSGLCVTARITCIILVGWAIVGFVVTAWRSVQ